MLCTQCLAIIRIDFGHQQRLFPHSRESRYLHRVDSGKARGDNMRLPHPLACVALLLGAAAAQAQAPAPASPSTYPDRPITLILPVSAGSAGDFGHRVVAQKMAENMKVAIVVENQAAAAGIVGTERVVRAKPDGYTLSGNGDAALSYAANLAPGLKFDPLNDLEPIGLIATIPWMLVASPNFGVKSLSEFIAKAKAIPGKIDYGTAGIGGASHIGMEEFAAQVGIKLNSVPYKGVTPAVTAAIGGEVQAVLAAVTLVQSHVKAGKLVALGVPLKERSPFMPEVPTFAEAGLPGFTFETWIALFAPKGTPRPILDKLRAELDKALADPEVKVKLTGAGLQPRSGSPAEVAQMLKTGHARVAKVIKDANIKAE
jgi:tripartite-type tricarboxylate transporter receptor subunit TctC